MTRESSCCCRPLSPSMDTAHFTLLFLLIAIYMLFGAAVFSSLERPAELLAHQLWETRLKDFSQEHNITFEALKSLLCHYEEARTAGIRTEKGRALWDIPGAFYFVGTVVSTIGKSRILNSHTLDQLQTDVRPSGHTLTFCQTKQRTLQSSIM